MKTFLVILLTTALISSCKNLLLLKDKQDSAATDTLFLEREIRDTPYPFYHAIYIETNRKSKYYDQLADFSYNEFGNLTRYNEEFNKRGIHLNKLKPVDLPVEWLPLYLYKNKYYVYIPSDWGDMQRQILTNSLLIYWGMEGPIPYVLTDLKKINRDLYSVFSTNYFMEWGGGSKQENVDIHIVDQKNKIAVWEYKNAPEEEYRYALYVAKEKIRNFDLIVNYCETDKQMEFEFEQPDFAALLKKIRSK